MAKPRIFLGSSGQQAALLESLTAGLADVADVEPWTIVFNPGTSTLDRLVELTHEVDFAAFIFAQDDWTAHGDAPARPPRATTWCSRPACSAGCSGCGARSSSMPTAPSCPRTSGPDLRAVRRDHPGRGREINQKLRNAIEHEGRLAKIEGLWWQHSLTMRTEEEPSAVSLLRIARDGWGRCP